MESSHFLNRAKSSFQTFVTLTEETELTRKVFNLLKRIEAGETTDDMMCYTCMEVACECNDDPERIGCDRDEDLPITKFNPKI